MGPWDFQTWGLGGCWVSTKEPRHPRGHRLRAAERLPSGYFVSLHARRTTQALLPTLARKEPKPSGRLACVGSVCAVGGAGTQADWTAGCGSSPATHVPRKRALDWPADPRAVEG